VRSSHKFFLTQPDVRRGQAYRGSAARLHKVAAKLVAGKAVHVAIVGGSTAWGQGALLGGNFGRRFFDWMNATFPVAAPHLAQHRFTNAAKPAISSSLYALCGNDMVPRDADLVILEFGELGRGWLLDGLAQQLSEPQRQRQPPIAACMLLQPSTITTLESLWRPQLEQHSNG
jgi:hypothetical protein